MFRDILEIERVITILEKYTPELYSLVHRLRAMYGQSQLLAIEEGVAIEDTKKVSERLMKLLADEVDNLPTHELMQIAIEEERNRAEENV